MLPRVRASACATALAILLSMPFSPAASADLATRVDPVVVPGDALAEWADVPLGDLRLVRWNGISLEPVPFQVDEQVLLVMEAIPAFQVPEHRERTFDWMGFEDRALDLDDELAFLPDALGPAAPAEAWIGGEDRRIAIRVEDPLSSQVGYAYLYRAPAEPRSGDDLVTGAPVATGVFRTAAFRTEYSGRWRLTGLAVEPAAGGDGVDLLDRVKGRAYDLENGETEELWEATSRFLGAIDGPVRAAREVMGAASGFHLTLVDVVYPRMLERTFHVRVHPMDDIWMYLDLDAAALPGTYHDARVSGVPIDGDPDVHPGGPPDWFLATTRRGSILVVTDERSPFPPLEPGGGVDAFLLDDEDFEDGTGDALGVQLGAGVHIRGLGDANAQPWTYRQRIVPLPATAGPAEAEAIALELRNPVRLAVSVEPRPAADVDADGDGLSPSQGDCNDADPAERLGVAAVDALRIRRDDPALIDLAWTGQEATSGAAIRYDVIEGPLGARDPYAGAACAAGGVAGPGMRLTDRPGSRWLLVRAVLPTCGPGSFGDSTLVPDPRDALDRLPPCP